MPIGSLPVHGSTDSVQGVEGDNTIPLGTFVGVEAEAFADSAREVRGPALDIGKCVGLAGKATGVRVPRRSD